MGRIGLTGEEGVIATTATNPKQEAHELIDGMSVGQAAALVSLSKVMLDAAEIALANAPIDDEPLTAEEIQALDGCREWLRHNQTTPHEEVLAEFGIARAGV